MHRHLGILLASLLLVDSYKILVNSPRFGHSHSTFMGRIADILTEAGHDVTTLISEISEGTDGTTLSRIIRVEQSKEAADLFTSLMSNEVADLFDMDVLSPSGILMIRKFAEVYSVQCKSLLEQPGLVERLKAEKFDVFITENFDMCGVGLSELIRPRSLICTATSTAFGPQLDEFGIPTVMSTDPALFVSRLNVHSMWDRLVNIYVHFLVRFAFAPNRNLIHDLFKQKYGANFPTLEQISSNSAYVFTNVEPLFDFGLPTINKVIPLGGIGATKPQKLGEYWERILSKRAKTVLFSFGSAAKAEDLPLNAKMSIIETMKALPDVTFIWKYEVDDDFTRDFASKIDNLELTKWMPQVDLLAHPNLSAFITHGGMGSTQEMALSGVPGVFIPIYADQPRNSLMMERNGLGKILDKSEITNTAKFAAVIKEVLEDNRYRENSRRLAAMLRKRPFTARELLVKHVEFAAEFGPSAALRPQSHDMDWIEYNNVDIIFTGITIGHISIFLSIKASMIVIGKIFSNSAKTPNDYRSVATKSKQ